MMKSILSTPRKIAMLKGMKKIFPVAFFALLPPSSWLKTVNPGFTPPWAAANFGLDFFSKQLVPFLVWAGVFFTIILSLAFLVIGGIMYSTAGGNKEGMAKAKGTITYALVGLTLGLSSVIILRFLENFFYP